jgi:hypothetical protein
MSDKVCGFILGFDDRAVIGPQKYERFPRNSIINNRVPLRVAHHKLPGTTFAWADISQNQFGYKFEALIPNRSNSHALARMIRGGCDSVSMSFRPISRRYNGTVAVIERARLTEISIVPRGAYPSARCWVAGPELSYAPPAIKALVCKWNEGKPISEVTAAQMLAAGQDDDEEEEEKVEQINDFMWITTEQKPKRSSKTSSSGREPVRAAVEKHIYQYLSRGPK